MLRGQPRSGNEWEEEGNEEMVQALGVALWSTMVVESLTFLLALDGRIDLRTRNWSIISVYSFSAL